MSPDINGLQLAARFSLPPNSLGYCGRDTAPQKFNSCVIHGECENVDEELEKFIVLHPYLKTIGELTGKPKFSHDVVDAYAMGNDLLEGMPTSGYDLLLDNFALQGVPQFFIEELRKNPPKKFIPTHLFQVLHVGVGKASGAVPFNLSSINSCMIRWGEITGLTDNEVTVGLWMLKGNPEINDFSLTNKTETLPYSGEFLKEVNIGDQVAVHWNQVIKVLTSAEADKLDKWTGRVLASLR